MNWKINKSVISLNIEPHEARLLVSEGTRIVYWGSTPLAEGIIRHGIIADQLKLSATLASLFSEIPYPKDKVVVSITGMRSITRIISIPKLKSKLVDDAILYEAEREMPVSLDELYLSWDLIKTANSQNFYYVIGIPRDLVDMQINTLIKAGIQPSALHLKPLALAKVTRSVEALIIDLEPETFDIVGLVGGVPVVMRTIVSRSNMMTIQDRIQQLSEELSRTIQFYNSGNPQQALPSTAPAFLTGSLATDPEIYESLKDIVGNPIEQLASPLDYPRDLPLPVPQYAVNIGLAMGNTVSISLKSNKEPRFSVVNPNILPKEYQPETTKLIRLLYPIIAAMLAMIMVIVLSMKFGTDSGINDIKAELDAVNQKINELNNRTSPIEAEIKNLEAEEQQLTQERDSFLTVPLATTIATRLESILDELPVNVALTSINKDSSSIYVEGSTDYITSISTYVTALEEAGLFTTVYASSISGGSGNTPVSFTIVCSIE